MCWDLNENKLKYTIFVKLIELDELKAINLPDKAIIRAGISLSLVQCMVIFAFTSKERMSSILFVGITPVASSSGQYTASKDGTFAKKKEVSVQLNVF